jgi:hypothetical protein
VQAFLVFGFMLMGATFGPMGAVLPELFPTNVRYTGSAIAYNVSSILGAAVAPSIALGCGPPPADSRGSWALPVGLRRAHPHRADPLAETKDVDYETNIGLGETGSL